MRKFGRAEAIQKQSVPEMVFAYFNNRYGQRALVDENIGSLVNTLTLHKRTDLRLEAFARWAAAAGRCMWHAAAGCRAAAPGRWLGRSMRRRRRRWLWWRRCWAAVRAPALEGSCPPVGLRPGTIHPHWAALALAAAPRPTPPPPPPLAAPARPQLPVRGVGHGHLPGLPHGAGAGAAARQGRLHRVSQTPASPTTHASSVPACRAAAARRRPACWSRAAAADCAPARTAPARPAAQVPARGRQGRGVPLAVRRQGGAGGGQHPGRAQRGAAPAARGAGADGQRAGARACGRLSRRRDRLGAAC
jgi:hypothetical protein